MTHSYRFCCQAFFVIAILLCSPIDARAGKTWEDLNSSVAEIYQKKDYEAGIPLAQDALRMAEADYGPESAETVMSLNSLAYFYKKTGRYAEAEPLYQRALKLSEKLLGKFHPDLIIPINNLAFLYAAEKKYEEANVLGERLIDILQKKFGENHPRVALALEKYAVIRREGGDAFGAQWMEDRAAKIRQKNYPIAKERPRS